MLEMGRVNTELADRHLNSVEDRNTETERNVFTRTESSTYILYCKQQQKLSVFSLARKARRIMV